MIRRILPLLVLLAPALAPAENWPGWRGPHGTGVTSEKGLPTRWSATQNVRWKVRLPGAGVSAPVVWGERVFVTSSDGRRNDRLHLYCYHRDDGRLLWHERYFGSALSDGQFPPGGMAVPTPTTDGKRVYALFGTGDLVCVDLDGKPVWLRSLAQEYGPFRNRWGMAASPLLVDDLLVIQVDHFGPSYLLGIDAATGNNRWRTPRATGVNWTSPLAVTVAGKKQVVCAGTGWLRGYAADTGKELWSLHGLHNQCIPSIVTSGDRLLVACGRDFTALAVRPGPVPQIAWKVPTRGVGVPSPVCLGDEYYYAEDSGWATCLRASTGERLWRERLGGKVQASAVAGDGKVYFTTEAGVVTVVRAGPKFAVLARNRIGEAVVASPALSQGCIFLRGDKHLFCIHAKDRREGTP